ncbi:DUF4082 domain-containing protein [Geodermatophilus sp. SYSU D00525]
MRPPELRLVPPGPPDPGPGPRRRWLVVVGATAAVLLALVLAVAWTGDDPGGTVTPVRPATLFPDGQGPDSDVGHTDGRPVELGIRFTATVDGTLTGLRFYRAAGDGAAHAATVWSSTGAVLGEATFPSRDTPGWQETPLDRPVPLTAGGVYVASYHADGGYVASLGWFRQPLPDPGPVAVVADGGAGVFRYSDVPVLPDGTYDAANYWIDVLFVPAGQATGPAPADPGSPTSAPAPAPTGPGASGRAAPGEVGFRGDRGDLTVVDGPDSAPPGTSWQDGTLVVLGDEVTLDHVWVRGSVVLPGPGVLTITDSVVEANGAAWSVVLAEDAAGELRISDSTIVWPEDVPSPAGDWGNGAVHGNAQMVLLRNDISGTPDGIQQGTGSSRFEENVVHDLRSLPGSHNDGIQLYGGDDVVVRGNHIVLDGPAENQNAAVFLSDDGGGFTAPVVADNYLVGGGFVLRLEAGCVGADVTGNDFGPLDGYGEVDVAPGASVDAWEDNVTADGSVLPRP